jgi:RNA polymerase sigma factor (sigma-70 family)
MKPSGTGEQGGGPETTAEVLARNYRQLRGGQCRSLSRRLGLTTEEFDELYQEAWQEVARRVQAGERILNYRGFVTQVMINKWKMELRGRRRHPALPLERASDVPDGSRLRGASPIPQPDEQVGAQERVLLALELIGSVSDDRRRKVLELRLAGDMSATEVQVAMGVTERTYRRLLTEAMYDIDAQLELVEQGRWCENRRELIIAYAEGRASADEAAQAKRHLGTCPPCRRVFASSRRDATRQGAERSSVSKTAPRV